jgi:hypothetical protein
MFALSTLSTRMFGYVSDAQQWVSNRVRSARQFIAGVGDRIASVVSSIKPKVIQLDAWVAKQSSSPDRLIELGKVLAVVCAAPFFGWAIGTGIYALVTAMLPILVLAAKAAAMGFAPLVVVAYAWKLYKWLQRADNRLKIADHFLEYSAFVAGVCVVAAFASIFWVEAVPYVWFWQAAMIGSGVAVLVAAIWRSTELRLLVDGYSARVRAFLEGYEGYRATRSGRRLSNLSVQIQSDRIADVEAHVEKPELPRPRKFCFVDVQGQSEVRGLYVCEQLEDGVREFVPVEPETCAQLRTWFGTSRTRELKDHSFWSLHSTPEAAIAGLLNYGHRLEEESLQAYLALQQLPTEVISSIPAIASIPVEDLSCLQPPKSQSCTQFCSGCSNYHGLVYGENLLVCGVHPYGVDANADRCPDYRTPTQAQNQEGNNNV